MVAWHCCFDLVAQSTAVVRGCLFTSWWRRSQEKMGKSLSIPSRTCSHDLTSFHKALPLKGSITFQYSFRLVSRSLYLNFLNVATCKNDIHVCKCFINIFVKAESTGRCALEGLVLQSLMGTTVVL